MRIRQQATESNHPVRDLQEPTPGFSYREPLCKRNYGGLRESRGSIAFSCDASVRCSDGPFDHVRGRRLSDAAKALSNGATDILSVALDAGYGSHEAFTRAFRDQFGVTPETIRAQGHVKKIELVDPIKIDETLRIKLEPPRFVKGRRLLIAGLGERYTCETSAAIPSQWQRFLPHLGQKQRYAMFRQRSHISTIRSTWNAIWNNWLPESGYEAVDAPDFECYGPLRTGREGFPSPSSSPSMNPVMALGMK
jgi:hypothetical protein